MSMHREKIARGDPEGRSGSPLRLLYVIVDLPVGGAEEHLLSLVRNLDRNRYAATVCCIGRSGQIGKEIEESGVKLVELRKLQKGGYDSEIVTLLREVLRREQTSLLHAHLYHANMYGRLAAFREDVPAVCSIHNTYINPKRHRRLINWWLARRTSFIIAGSEAIKNDILRYDGVPSEKVRVIHYGVDVGKFGRPLAREKAREKLGLPTDRFYVGTVGRLEEQKGQNILVEAVARLRREGTEMTVLLIGSGREEKRLRAQVAREGVTDNVLFLGTRRDLPELFRAMDVFALPSLWEGLPLALLSAMASGLPVVVTPVGGIPEIVRDGGNGFLVPPGDPVALAATLRRVRGNPGEALTCGDAAAETVRVGYSQRRNAERIMEVYEEVLAGQFPAGP
jgi:glycosyltransferase involved in cell wall biosynthesis